MKRLEIILALVAIVALIIAVLAWLFPFSPVGTSPFVPSLTAQVQQVNQNNEMATSVPASATETSDTSVAMEIRSIKGVQILERGTILIGVRHESMYPMFFQDGRMYKGFEIDLATEIVGRLFGNQVTIEWMPLRPEERFPAIESNRIDLLIRNTTHTKSRESQVLFTRNYFLDGVRLLVRRSDGYQGLQDLEGKTVVFPNDTAVIAVQDAAREAGVNLNIIVDEDVATVFNERRSDAIAVDWSSHGLYVEDYNAHHAIGELFTSEPLAILVSLNDPDFRGEIDSTLLAIISDGTWQTIYERWFPEPHPWSSEEMLAEPPADR